MFNALYITEKDTKGHILTHNATDALHAGI